MNAYKIVHEKGLDNAKEELNRMYILRWVTPEIQEMKQAIADFELVNFYGGYEKSALILAMDTCLSERPLHKRHIELKQAIQRIEKGLSNE